jgi:glycosyltransferase involved in cell wall biosynthesis
MKISLDAQNLFEEKKTGIGFTVQKIIENMDLSGDDEFQLNYFAFRDKKKKGEQIRPYKELGYHLKRCGWFPYGLYRRIWNKIPVPYSWLVGGKTDITQFFHYAVPPGADGKKLVFIYDMVWKACPETMEEENRRYVDQNTKLACDRADIIITISEFSRQEIMKYMNLPEDRVKVVPCGVDLERFRPDYNIEAIGTAKERSGIHQDYILYLGTLEPRKNLVYLVESYAKLCMEEPDAPVLVLAGKKGWQYDLIFERVQQLNITEKVIFTGYVEDDDVPLLLAGAKFFVFPSLYEGFGLPPLEAMACGTPVIVSNKSSLPEVVGDAGIQVDIESPEALKDAMQMLNRDEELRENLKKKGIARAQNFTWKRSSMMLKEIYHQIPEA